MHKNNKIPVLNALYKNIQENREFREVHNKRKVVVSN